MTTFHGETAVQIFRLTSLRAQLKLEQAGLKSSGGPIRPRIAAEFNLSPRNPRHHFMEAIDERLADLKAQLQPGDITP